MMLIKCFPKCKDETINGDNMKEKWFLTCDFTSKAFMNIYEYQTENITIELHFTKYYKSPILCVDDII